MGNLFDEIQKAVIKKEESYAICCETSNICDCGAACLASVSNVSSMIILSQIVFVILLYFGINYLVTMILLKRSEKWVH